MLKDEFSGLERDLILAGQGYIDLPNISYNGGMDDVFSGICENLPKDVRRLGLVRSNNGEIIEHQIKPNLIVVGIPIKPNEAGVERSHIYTPAYKPVGDFVMNSLDHQYTTMKILPMLIEKYKFNKESAIIHTHDWLTSRIGIELQQEGLPFVFQVHMSVLRPSYKDWFCDYPSKGEGVDKRLIYEKEAAERADIVVTVSDELRKEVIKSYQLSPRKVITFENAIDTNLYKPATEEELPKIQYFLKSLSITQPYVFICGRFVPQKNFSNAILAFAKFSENHPEHQLVVAGFNGPSEYVGNLFTLTYKQKPHIRERIKVFNQEFPLHERIMLYQGSNFGLFPSLVETFGLTATYQQGVGRPVVVSNVGGFLQNVKNGETGTHVNPYDCDAIVDGMERVHQHPEWGINARKYMLGKYSWEQRIKELLRIYAKL